MKHLNNNVVRTLVTYALYAVVIASIALIVSGLFESATITVDWVRLLIGGAILYAVGHTCDRFFSKKIVKKDNTTDRH